MNASHRHGGNKVIDRSDDSGMAIMSMELTVKPRDVLKIDGWVGTGRRGKQETEAIFVV